MNPSTGFLKAKQVEKRLNQAIESGQNLDGWIAETERLDQKVNTEISAVNEQMAQMADLECDLSAHGISPDSDVDYTAQIKALIPQYKRFVIKGGRYNISEELVFKHGQSLRMVGKVTFEAKNFIGVTGSSVVRVTNDGDKYTSLPTLTSNVVRGNVTLAFTTAHNLQAGDIICLYDNTDNSYSSARTYYKKGEFARVNAVVSDVSITLDSPLFDNYTVIENPNFGVYKMNMGTFNIDGDFEVIQTKTGNYNGIIMERVKNGSYPKISAYANNKSTRAMVLDQCFNIRLDGTFVQQVDSGLGVDYGLCIVNSQHIYGNVYCSSNQHGITTGGYNGIGAVVNRDINLRGSANSTYNSYAIGLHGNTEYFSFDGVALGGIMAAGNFTRFKGTVTNSSSGVSVIMYEASGMEHDFSGMTIISEKNGSPNGVVDFSGTGTNDVANMKGGTFNLSNAKIIAKNSVYGVVIRLRNPIVDTTQKRFINMSNMSVQLVETGTAVGYRITDETGQKPYDFINLQGFVSNGTTPIMTGVLDSIHTRKTGVDEIQLSTTVSLVTKAIKFPVAFPSGYKPSVTLNMNASASGGYIRGEVNSVDNTGFSVRVSSMNNSNFTTNNITGFSWTAQ